MEYVILVIDDNGEEISEGFNYIRAMPADKLKECIDILINDNDDLLIEQAKDLEDDED